MSAAPLVVGARVFCLVNSEDGSRSKSGARRKLIGAAQVRIVAQHGDRFTAVVTRGSGVVVGSRLDLARDELFAADDDVARAAFAKLVRSYWGDLYRGQLGLGGQP